jgi:AcrR family transcriptional regulator
VTVERVMARTTLSREAFYAYFRDRHELVARLAQRLRREIDAQAEGYRATGAGDRFTAGRVALKGFVRLYVEHGALLRALADAAARTPRPRGHGGRSSKRVTPVPPHGFVRTSGKG